jgi:hypothetical protein
MGADQSISMLDNYYNTFEDFTVPQDAVLDVNAYNNSGRTFNVINKDFSDVDGELNFIGGSGNDTFNANTEIFTAVEGDINLIGGGGNDTFYANYDALLSGTLEIEGGDGADTVDVRTTQTNAALTLDNPAMFENIERLELDQISSTNSVTMDATVMDDWISGDTLTLDLANNDSQSSQVEITNTQPDNTTVTDFVISSTDYTIAPIDNDTFAMQVV